MDERGDDIMKKTAFLKRRCEKCPQWTQTVCRHAGDKYWNAKSNGGEGCDLPMDDVAEAWRKAGWTPGAGATQRLALPLPPRPLPKMPRRPKRSTQLELGKLNERKMEGV